jgi:hypothetical protein
MCVCVCVCIYIYTIYILYYTILYTIYILPHMDKKCNQGQCFKVPMCGSIYIPHMDTLNTTLGYISCDRSAIVQIAPKYAPWTHPLRNTLQVSRYPFHPASLYRLPVVKPFCSKVRSDFFNDKIFGLVDVLQRRLEVNKG